MWKKTIIFLIPIVTISTSLTAYEWSQDKPKEIIVDFRDIAKKAIPGVVSIRVKGKATSSSLHGLDSDDPLDLFGNRFFNYFNIPRQEKKQTVAGQASGVIVSSDGYILTNNHVVEDMDSIIVQLNDGREFQAKVLGQDPNSDLAVIKVEANDLPYLTFGNSDELEVGQWVAAVGNPLGLSATLTKGVVSGQRRNNLGIVPYEDFIQTDASINSGNSGGPLLSLDNKVVGINTAIATNGSSGNMGIGFAIPSNMAKYVLNEIKEHGKVTRGFLGVVLQSIDYNLAQAFDLKKIEGALVTGVKRGSPGDKAGIKEEDIIVKMNDRPIENAAILRNSVYMIHPGTKINLTVLRDGKILQIPLVVGEYTEEVPVAKQMEKNKLGFEVETMTQEQAQALGYNDKGVIITEVSPGSVAALAGLKKGALIVSVNRNKVETVEQFYAALKNTTKGRPALFQVKQGDQNIYISLQQ